LPSDVSVQRSGGVGEASFKPISPRGEKKFKNNGRNGEGAAKKNIGGGSQGHRGGAILKKTFGGKLKTCPWGGHAQERTRRSLGITMEGREDKKNKTGEKESVRKCDIIRFTASKERQV